MKINLKVWRQKNSEDKGHFENYVVDDIHEDTSFLEMFDILNERLVAEGKPAIVFDHDCREGICGWARLMKSCLLANSRTATQSWSSPGARAPSPSGKT